jgi:hypothetical protein
MAFGDGSGTLSGFINSLSNNTDNGIMGKTPDSADMNNVTPDNFMKNKEINNDARNIYDDQGNIVDLSSSSLRDILKGVGIDKAPPGTMRNFLNRILPGNPTDVGSATDTGELASPGTATARNLSSTPEESIPLPRPKPMIVPGMLPPEALPELRNSLLTGAGLNPQHFQPDENSLNGRMNSPNSKVDMQTQQQEMQDISQQFRGAGPPTGPIERAKPKKHSEANPFTQLADVTTLHPPGTFSRNTQGGDLVNGVAKELGIRPPANIIPVPYPLKRG